MNHYWQDIISENKENERFKPIPDPDYSTNPDIGFSITELCKKLIEEGGGRALYFRYQINWDIDYSDLKEELLCQAINVDGTFVTGEENLYLHLQ